MHTPVAITAHAHLPPEQIVAVVELAAAVRATGIDPRLNEAWIGARDGSREADWLAWDGARLVGIAATERFGETVEATIALLPDAPPETAAALYAALCRALPQQGATQLLVLHDRGATMLRALAEAHNLTFDHAEQLMRRPGELGVPAVATGALQIMRAEADLLPAVAQVLTDGWGGDQAATLARIQQSVEREAIRYYVALLDGKPVAALNIQMIEGRPWVYGFVVRESYRGKGYGRQLVVAALVEVLTEAPGDVFLEVDPANTPAIKLYHSLGFAVVRTFYYWAKELPDGTYS
jgi:ribosomal protein S18 acetylase RimI-like enzyme